MIGSFHANEAQGNSSSSHKLEELDKRGDELGLLYGVVRLPFVRARARRDLENQRVHNLHFAEIFQLPSLPNRKRAIAV